MSPLPLKIFLISLICIANMVVVNTGPVTRVQKTAADNLLAKRDGPLIGYLIFVQKEDAVVFEDGKFPDSNGFLGVKFLIQADCSRKCKATKRRVITAQALKTQNKQPPQMQL
ncbi:hypothetical protein F5890DRAFT_1536252 [Lentinula detonsa]|uniref:Uncharacterized protein n=1 Tax=Lentinula detonsa TaxID=2804962 RepID=A0AA38URG2_9AGAR|nr:hypothetical protein F5890DRAFT_1536252 [Lentinula detonsa]